MRLPTLFVIAAVVASGCTQPITPTTGPTTQEPSRDLAFADLVAATTCLGGTCYEPNVAVDPDGRLFASDASTSDIGVSTDGGATWTHQKPPPMPAGLTGIQSDVLVQVSPKGRLYWSALVVWRPANQGFVLEGIQIAWSDDAAKTWAGNVHLSPMTVTPQVLAPDRQWLGFGPGDTVYVTYNQIPTGIWFARSDDAGKTWGGWTRAAPLEGRGGGIGQSGPPVVDSKGRVYVPACDIQASSTAVFASSDRGATFRKTLVGAGCSWFPILTVTPDDDVVLATQNGAGVHVAHSKDGGATFSKTMEWAAGATAAPWPLGLGNGSLVVAWFKPAGQDAELHITIGDVVDGPSLDVVVGSTKGATAASRTTALTDFASASLLPDGRLATVLVQGKTPLVAVSAAPVSA